MTITVQVDRTQQTMIAWLRGFFGSAVPGVPDLEGRLLILDPLGMPWPKSFHYLSMVELTAEMPGPTPSIEGHPILLVGRPAAPSETELLARSSLLLADPVGARSAPEIRAAFAGGLPANVLRRCDCVVEVQSPTLLYTHKNRWGGAGEVLEFAPLEPACWNEPLPSR